jgi:hypothetical protein
MNIVPHAQILSPYSVAGHPQLSLIILYTAPLGASNTNHTPSQLANNIFVINVNETKDVVNARSQVLRCSRGKLNYIPMCSTPVQLCSSNNNLSIYFKNGILSVPITYIVIGIYCQVQ